jgi:DNA-binding transcriptional LysR family regulator
MDTRDFEYFAVIAERRNMRHAAEVLGLSQPALSKAVRRLETSLGVKLFERAARGVELTSVGTALFGQIAKLRLTHADVAREVVDLSQGRAGMVRVGTSPVIAEDLPIVCAALMRESPKVTLQITVTDNDEMVPALRKAELDLIYNFLPDYPYEGTAQERLFDDEFVVYASAAHPLARKKRVSVADLEGARWALTVPAIRSQQRVHHVLQESGQGPANVAVELRSLRLRLQICACSDVLGYTSRRIVDQASRSLGLKVLPVKELVWRRPVGLILRRDAYLPPAAYRIVELLKSAAHTKAAGARS